MDAPDFNLGVERWLKQRGIRTVHYVAPSVWAWRPGRAAKMARSIDHVLAILPFEPPLMRAAGMTCDFVGHPVVAEPRATPAAAARFRARHGIAPGAPLVLCLPGSRRGEIARLGRTLRRWRDAFLAYFTTGRSSNGGTEAVNGIIELHRRLARGYRNRHNYRLRMLLAAGGLTP